MWVILLAGVYVACGAVLLAVLLQDRAKAVGVGRRREGGDGERRAHVMPDMVFRTHA
jgi:hypothetical protein